MKKGLELIPGALSLHVLSHEVAAGAPLPCWSFISEGLAALGQREVVLTLRVGEDEELGEATAEAAMLFRTLHQLASEGRSVEAGGFTVLGEASPLFGRRGLVYTEVQGLEDLPLPGGALAAHLLTAEEAAVGRELSALRVLGRLGRSTRFFPWPCWSDRGRAPVAVLDEDSVLARMPRLHVPGMEVFGLDGRVVLSIPEAGAAATAEALEELPADTAFALTGTPSVRGDGCLVWSPGQAAPEAITRGAVRPFRMTGAFLGVAPEVEADRTVNAEDGYIVMLTAASWRLFRESLAAGERLSLAEGAFELMIRGRKPGGFGPAMSVTLEEPEELFDERMGLAQLTDVVEAAAAAGAAPGASLRLTLEPPAAITVEGPKAEAVAAALPPVLIRGGPLHLRLDFQGLE